MSKQMIVGLVGPAGCGKTTAAVGLAMLKGGNFVRRRFAAPLKDMLHALGLTKEHTDGALKEEPCELLGGKTPRHAMQTLGTEWGRALITDDLWIRAWRAALPTPDINVVIDDCRFPNEAAAIRELGGVLIRINRPGFVHAATHESEAHELSADVSIDNSGSAEDLVVKLQETIDALIVAKTRIETHVGSGLIEYGNDTKA